MNTTITARGSLRRDGAVPAPGAEGFPQPMRRLGADRHTRRSLLSAALATAGALGAGGALAACGDGAAPQASKSFATGAATGADLDVARLSASIEILAVQAYGAAIGATTAGAVGKVPAAFVALLATARQHHVEHAQAWNAVLTGHGQAAQSDPDPAVAGPTDPAMKAASTVSQLAALMLKLENVALQTYINSLTSIQDANARQVALTIAPVEAQHAAILNVLLGRYPVPDGSIPNDYARGVEDLKGGASPSGRS